MNQDHKPIPGKATAEEYSEAALALADLWRQAGHTTEELGEALAAYTRQMNELSKMTTGLDFLRTASCEEIAEVLASGHPPVGVVHCDLVTCRDCWLHWLHSGGPIPCPCKRKEAKA